MCGESLRREACSMLKLRAKTRTRLTTRQSGCRTGVSWRRRGTANHGGGAGGARASKRPSTGHRTRPDVEGWRPAANPRRAVDIIEADARLRTARGVCRHQPMSRPVTQPFARITPPGAPVPRPGSRGKPGPPGRMAEGWPGMARPSTAIKSRQKQSAVARPISAARRRPASLTLMQRRCLSKLG